MRTHPPTALVQLAGGGLGYRRALAADSGSWRGGTLLGALEAAGSDGPWERGDDLGRLNALARYSRGDEARLDAIDNGLYHTEERLRLGTTREDEVLQAVGGPYAEARVVWTPWLRTVTGLRLDSWWADVASDLEANSGAESALLLSPKLSVVLGPWRETELYLNAGYGFHSNDARGATIRVDPRTGEPVERVDPLVRARGADLGLRTERVPGLQSSVSFLLLDLDSELLFIGDAGGTEATRPSRLIGVELANFWQPRPWLRLDVDLAFSRARFRDHDPAGDRVPGAVERVASEGVAFEELGRFSGGLRLRHFGPRDLVEDGSVRSEASTLLYAQAGVELLPDRFRGLRLAAEVYNLLDEEVSDIDYLYEPREGIHLHPAEPRSVRLVLEWRGR